jgi:hypothetical protein
MMLIRRMILVVSSVLSGVDGFEGGEVRKVKAMAVAEDVTDTLWAVKWIHLSLDTRSVGFSR